MRSLLVALSFGLAAAALSPAFAGPAAYMTLPQRDVVSCARACADDGLCIAWVLQPSGACQLSATVPADWPESASNMGLSRRAPAFAALPPRPAAPIRATIEEPPSAISGSIIDADYALLGGPDDEALRTRSRQ